MKIAFVEINNFRKLLACRIDFSEQTTVLVGANNSGKTSAMDALIAFLHKRNEISTRDFTISHWIKINKIGDAWLDRPDTTEEPSIDIIEQFESILPSIDIWLDVKPTELHYVCRIIPTLNWSGGKLGVRLRFEPKDIEKLQKDFIDEIGVTKELTKGLSSPLRSLTTSLKDFLSKGSRLQNYFKVSSYILDPVKSENPVNGIAKSQKLPPNSNPLEFDPFEGIIRINIINAQRGFSDPNSDESSAEVASSRTLSAQLRDYYGKHINPIDSPEQKDLDALKAIENAQDAFDENMNAGFSSAIKELESLGYPGFSDPKISLSSKVHPIDTLNHSSSVQFEVIKGGGEPLRLPEKYNGLGYQNLISIIFRLMRYRDDWMRVGKRKLGSSINSTGQALEPLHLVLIEEPEAHLHAQVQQVFINKAYGVLRNHVSLGKSDVFSSQMIVSTHSSHLAHEIDFTCIRYFRRCSASCNSSAPSATVVNLSEVFGSQDETAKFAIRYLKTTHCDLFFADAAILVEGPAERILVPHFIKHKFNELTQRYISILEIGGSHAHRLRPLIESLGLITLVITDIDSIDTTSKEASLPARKADLVTNNATLKTWIPMVSDIDTLLDLDTSAKTDSKRQIRVAYQTPNRISEYEALPYTFEDSLYFANIDFFKDLEDSEYTGFLKKISGIAKSGNQHPVVAKNLFAALRSGNKKAELALDLLYASVPGALTPPSYIADGLNWLAEKLRHKDDEFSSENITETVKDSESAK